MNTNSQKTIGLVLGGGGVRGFFHAGVIKGLQELKVNISHITGTSIGAIVGTIYAADPTINFEKIAREINFLDLTRNLLIASQDRQHTVLTQFLQRYIKVRDFSELKIPLSFNATDINHQKELVFSTGPIFPGLVASMSIPGVFPPVKVDDDYLVDGGVINNLPVSLLPPMSKIILSDINLPIKKIDQKTPVIDILYSSLALMQKTISLQEINKLRSSQIIHLPLENNTFILDFRKQNYQTLIDLGYQSVVDHRAIID